MGGGLSYEGRREGGDELIGGSWKHRRSGGMNMVGQWYI